MNHLQFQYKYISGFLSEDEIHLMQDEIDVSHSLLVEKAGKGNEFLGWMDLPLKTDEEQISRIETDAGLLRSKAEIIVITGAGDSCVGSRALIEALKAPFAEFDGSIGNPVIIYAGHHLGQDYHAELLRLLDKKEYALVAISGSENTIESDIAFRLLKHHIEKKYGIPEASRRIIAISGAKAGLKIQADLNTYKTYVVAENTSGSYRVLSPVGLIPMAVAGYDIRQLLGGAAEMRKVCVETPSLNDNPAACYAAIRSSLYRMGYQIEIMVNYDPALHFFTEWWKQLFAESEGKENEGLFPATVDLTTELQGMGQYLQHGQRILFETVIHMQKTRHLLSVPNNEADPDDLNYLAGKTLQQVNDMATLATTLAHTDAEVPNLDILLPALDEWSLGELIYFFEFAAGLSAYLSGLNPFTRPGVDAYKNNMFALLGKPGFENETDHIRSRINEV